MDTAPLVDHIPSLRRYARALTGDAWAADDLVQDTLERACSKWRLWTAGSDLRAWLFTIMHNLFASQLRRSPPRAVVDIADVAHELRSVDSRRDDGIDLQRCLLLLPEDQRAVLLLVALEDLSYAQVAKVLGIPVGTVMSRLSRARRRLHELMDGGPATMAANRPGLRRLK
ncbi:MAG: RNA polymerase sigma factor [Variovorax sp.]